MSQVQMILARTVAGVIVAVAIAAAAIYCSEAVVAAIVSVIAGVAAASVMVALLIFFWQDSSVAHLREVRLCVAITNATLKGVTGQCKQQQ